MTFSMYQMHARPGRRADDGVTLIEMMVVLVIIGTMAGLAMTGLFAGSSQRKLSGAAEVLMQRLALASDEAMVTGRTLAFDARDRDYGFVQWLGASGWQPLTAGPLALRTDLDDAIEISAYAQNGTALAAIGPHVISPGGDADGFRVELQVAGNRRIVLFDGLNAREINADAEQSDDG